MRRPLVAVLGLSLILGGQVWAQNPQGNRVSSSTECYRRLAREVHTASPSMCGRPVHWFVGLDVSGSTTRGGWHDWVVGMLMDWARYTVAPGDRVTMLTFAHDLQVQGPVDVGSSDVLCGWIANQVEVRLPPEEAEGKTELVQARERLLDLAVHSDMSAHAVLTLLLADRSTDDSTARAGAPPTDLAPELVKRFGHFLAPTERPNTTTTNDAVSIGVDGLTRFIIDGQGDEASVYCFHAVAKSASDVAPVSGFPARYIPGPGGRTTIVRNEPVLRNAVRRIWLVVLIAVALVSVAFLFAALRDNRAATLIIENGAHHFPLWPPWRPRSTPIRASLNASGLCLKPLVEGLQDPVVAHASVPPWALQASSVLVTVLPETPYELRLPDAEDDRRRWQSSIEVADPSIELDEERAHDIEVRTSAGPIAAGKLSYSANSALIRRAKSGLYLAAATLVLAIAGPVIVAAVPAPRPTIIRPPEREALCESMDRQVHSEEGGGTATPVTGREVQ